MYSMAFALVLAALPGQVICRPCVPCVPEAAQVSPSDAQPAAEAPKPEPRTPLGWPIHSREMPQPVVITPPTESTQEAPGAPPSDAIVLFDGTNFDAWQPSPPKEGKKIGWKIENGYMEVVPGTGAIEAKQRFGDIQLHLEWATPSEVKGDGQGRGNSGVKLLPLLEVQVLDSYENVTYPDGQAAAIYGKYPPLVNASRKPGEWQYYDIVFYAPKVKDGQMIEPGSVTVFHNGILVHHAAKIEGNVDKVILHLQDHRNPVRYRNIWVRELHPYCWDGEKVVEPPKPEEPKVQPEAVEPQPEPAPVYVPRRRGLFRLFRR